MAESILTSYGEQQIADAIAQGKPLNINKFIISSDIVTLSQDLETLPNIVATYADMSKFSIVKVASNTVEFRIYLNSSDGDYDIGTIGILDNEDRLISASTLDEIIEKKRTTNEQQGNTLQFKIPVNIENASQLVTSITQQFMVDNTTILINSEGELSCGVVPHHVFDIFQNASTHNPPGALPLWTGEVVYCEGAHEEFYSKAVEFAGLGYIRSVTSATYDAEVAAKGWTNGFVINSSSTSVRLPKFKGVLYFTDPSNPSTLASNTTTSSTTTGFITLPTYIQVDTAAVPATVAQCNAFIDSLSDFASQFVTLSTIQSVTANKTWGGTQTYLNSPIAPTPAPTDSSTKVATTAFVSNRITSGIGFPSYKSFTTITSGYVATENCWVFISFYHSGDGANTLTVSVNGTTIGGYQSHDYDNQNIIMPLKVGDQITYTGASIRFAKVCGMRY